MLATLASDGSSQRHCTQDDLNKSLVDLVSSPQFNNENVKILFEHAYTMPYQCTIMYETKVITDTV